MCKKEEYCMNFTNTEIINELVSPLSGYPGINVRLSSGEDEELPQDTVEIIKYVSFDGEKSEFYIRFLGCETAIFILNQEFMFIDDDAKEISIKENARAAMGIRADGNIVFIACDYSGATYSAIEAELEKLKAIDILMLDGGGSTSFYAEGGMKIESQTGGRNVASVFEVYK